MSRTLTAGMQTAVAAQTGTVAHFFQIEYSGGTLRFATSPVDISWDSQTWDGIGGTVLFGGVEETTDSAGQGVEVTLSGVDQTIISALLNNQVRGYEVTIWLAHISDLGAIIADPLEIFRGYQLADYRITESRSREGGTVEVKTRVMSRLARIKNAQAIRTNVASHNDMLKRAGLSTGDTFFQNVPAIAMQQIYWGNRPVRGSGTVVGEGTRQTREDGTYS